MVKDLQELKDMPDGQLLHLLGTPAPHWSWSSLAAPHRSWSSLADGFYIWI